MVKLWETTRASSFRAMIFSMTGQARFGHRENDSPSGMVTEAGSAFHCFRNSRSWAMSSLNVMPSKDSLINLHKSPIGLNIDVVITVMI